MTLPRLEVIVAHWDRVPPASVSLSAIARYYGVGREAPKAPKGAAKRSGDEEVAGSMHELMSLLGANGFGSEKPAWLSPAAATT